MLFWVEDEVREGDIRYLSVSDLTELNQILIRQYTPLEPVGVLKPNELSSAQQRPAQYRAWEGTNDIFVLAAVLFEAIARYHVFLNANKRTAYAACRAFLLINGYKFDPPIEEVIRVALDTAEFGYDPRELAAWIDRHTTAVNCEELLAAMEGAISSLAAWPVGEGPAYQT